MTNSEKFSGPFRPGFDPRRRPGGPKSKHGRRRVLDLFDVWLNDDNGKGDKLRAAWQEAFDKDPLKFWERYIVPLLPKEASIEMDDGIPGLRITVVQPGAPAKVDGV